MSVSPTDSQPETNFTHSRSSSSSCQTDSALLSCCSSQATLPASATFFFKNQIRGFIRGFLQTTYETATNFIPGDAEQPPRVQTPAVLKAHQPGSLPFFHRFQRQQITFKLNKRRAAKVTAISAIKRSCHMCPALFFGHLAE